ncbi:MAG: hypothetical protein NTW86_24365 [Candidatus Sumerlaeota bacterium]|nr:hypothetical protein [Candidatus Sumerlaeota bacterium]
MDSQCPFCRGSIAADAIKCLHCQSVVADYKICPDCRESVPAPAAVCKFCGHRWTAPASAAHEEGEEDILRRVWADPLGALVTMFSPTAVFFPPELTITRTEARIHKWSLFGLRANRQRISLERIASVRYQKGIFWGAVIVETFGGTTGDLVISGLSNQDARETALLLEKLATHR